MINTISDILKAFAAEERKKLDEFKLRHGPTIGAMYEGLSREILERAIPEFLNLQVVDGFISFDDEQSGQIDCMLVQGEGTKIPSTESYIWPIQDVITVFEVKKTLNMESLEDSFFHLREVNDLFDKYILSSENREESINIARPMRIFSQITGIALGKHEESYQLDFDKQLLYHMLVNEYLSPVRIVIGHHGWKKEKTLRDNIYKMLAKRMTEPQGMGVASFPQLMIAGDFSLVKANGFPFSPPLIDGMWPFLCSSRSNPLKLMLEFIWTRLDCLYHLGSNLWGGDEQIENLTPCILAKAIQEGDKSGWVYEHINIPEKTLRSRPAYEEWMPVEINATLHSVFVLLCKGVPVKVDDPDLVEFAQDKAGGIDNLVDDLVATRLVALKDNKLVLTTQQCQCLITPDGRVWAGENNAGQLTKWMEKSIGKPNDEWNILAVNVSKSDNSES